MIDLGGHYSAAIATYLDSKDYGMINQKNFIILDTTFEIYSKFDIANNLADACFWNLFYSNFLNLFYEFEFVIINVSFYLMQCKVKITFNYYKYKKEYIIIY